MKFLKILKSLNCEAILLVSNDKASVIQGLIAQQGLIANKALILEVRRQTTKRQTTKRQNNKKQKHY